MTRTLTPEAEKAMEGIGAEPDVAERTLARAYADKIEQADVEAFAWLLDLVFTHDNEAEDAKAMIVKALREYGARP